MVNYKKYTWETIICSSCTTPYMEWVIGVGLEESYVINFTDIPHDPDEIKRMDPHNNDTIDYNWSIKDRWDMKL